MKNRNCKDSTCPKLLNIMNVALHPRLPLFIPYEMISLLSEHFLMLTKDPYSEWSKKSTGGSQFSTCYVNWIAYTNDRENKGKGCEIGITLII